MLLWQAALQSVDATQLLFAPTDTPDPQTGTQFIVCDGGGSTADISAYRVKANILNAISLDEIGLPSCTSDLIYFVFAP